MREHEHPAILDVIGMEGDGVGFVVGHFQKGVGLVNCLVILERQHAAVMLDDHQPIRAWLRQHVDGPGQFQLFKSAAGTVRSRRIRAADQSRSFSENAAFEVEGFRGPRRDCDEQ